MDNTDLERQQAESDKNIRGISLGVGALPAAGLMARLFQATQGYKTGVVKPPSSSPQPILPPFIQQLIDAGINDIAGLVDWIIQHAPNAIPVTIQTVEKVLPPFIQNLLDLGITDTNGVLNYLGLPSLPGTVSTPVTRTDLINPPREADAGYTFVSAGFKTQLEAQSYAAGVPGGIVKQASDSLYYVEQPTITGGRH